MYVEHPNKMMEMKNNIVNFEFKLRVIECGHVFVFMSETGIRVRY